MKEVLVGYIRNSDSDIMYEFKIPYTDKKILTKHGYYLNEDEITPDKKLLKSEERIKLLNNKAKKK